MPIFFSIIIPTYNSANTLAACLESILNQTFQNFEIIIVDGVSTDNTFSIVKHYQNECSNIRWFSEKDKGIYDAMNKGICLAKGGWIFFLGSDDTLGNNETLKKVFNCNLENHNVIYGNARLIGDTVWAKDGDIYDGKFDLKKLLTKNICHQTIFYNLSYLKRNVGLFNIDYNVCSDWDFNLRCWANDPMFYIDIIVCNFYGGGMSTRSDIDENFSRDFKDNVIKYFSVNNLKDQLGLDELLKFGIVNSITKFSGIKKWFHLF